MKLFVTGTDTGVGKTLVTCALAHKARAAGLSVSGYKPAESGFDEATSDARAIMEACGGKQNLAEIAPYRLAKPLAPFVAAQLEGIELDSGLLVSRIPDDQLVLVEGAGGLLVPYAAEFLAVDFARHCDAVVLVSRGNLGTMNHTLLSLEALRHRGIGSIHVVVSTPEILDPELLDPAVEVIAKMGKPNTLEVLPPVSDAKDAASRLNADYLFS